MSEQAPLEFEREKWLAEYELRKREIELKERDASRSRWSSPLVLALLAAAIAALGNAAAIWLTGIAQRSLETTKTEQARIIEESKAEAARILEVIKTGNPDKAAENLKFLVDAGLISDATRRTSIQEFLAARVAGQGPTLPPPVGWQGWRPPTEEEARQQAEQISEQLQREQQQAAKKRWEQLEREYQWLGPSISKPQQDGKPDPVYRRWDEYIRP
jgi:hypothetical protein